MLPDSIHVLRFHAGDHECGIAAAAVRGFRPPRPGTPHVATLIKATTETSDPTRQRELLLTAGERLIPLTVDGPIRMVQLHRRDLLAPPRALAASIAPVFGFAQLVSEPRLLLLLDADRLVSDCGSIDLQREGTSS